MHMLVYAYTNKHTTHYPIYIVVLSWLFLPFLSESMIYGLVPKKLKFPCTSINN